MATHKARVICTIILCSTLTIFGVFHEDVVDTCLVF